MTEEYWRDRATRLEYDLEMAQIKIAELEKKLRLEEVICKQCKAGDKGKS